MIYKPQFQIGNGHFLYFSLLLLVRGAVAFFVGFADIPRRRFYCEAYKSSCCIRGAFCAQQQRLQNYNN